MLKWLAQKDIFFKDTFRTTKGTSVTYCHLNRTPDSSPVESPFGVPQSGIQLGRQAGKLHFKASKLHIRPENDPSSFLANFAVASMPCQTKNTADMSLKTNRSELPQMFVGEGVT